MDVCFVDGRYPHNKKRHVETQTWICHQVSVLYDLVKQARNSSELIYTCLLMAG